MDKNCLSKTIPLRNAPADVEDIIRKEQLRLEMKEDLRLKKPEVVYKILREWQQNQSAHQQ